MIGFRVVGGRTTSGCPRILSPLYAYNFGPHRETGNGYLDYCNEYKLIFTSGNAAKGYLEALN